MSGRARKTVTATLTEVTTMKAFLLALGFGLAALAGCGSSGGGSCPDNAPLDCGNGQCCPTSTPYYCSNNVTPACYTYGPTGGSACIGYILCGGGGGGSGQCAHWSCGTSSQCAQVMGAPSGVQCQFASGQTCAQWCQQYIPGNCTCS